MYLLIICDGVLRGRGGGERGRFVCRHARNLTGPTPAQAWSILKCLLFKRRYMFFFFLLLALTEGLWVIRDCFEIGVVSLKTS